MPVFIEWLEGGVLRRGILKKEDKARLQVISLTGRSLAVPSKRFMIRHQGTGEGSDFFEHIADVTLELDDNHDCVRSRFATPITSSGVEN